MRIVKEVLTRGEITCCACQSEEDLWEVEIKRIDVVICRTCIETRGTLIEDQIKSMIEHGIVGGL